MASPSTLRQLLARGGVPIGTFAGLGSIDAIELICHAGFDFVVVDLQHGAFDLPTARHAIRAIDAAGACAVARLPANDWACVEPLLDAGYSALIAPMVNTPEHARAFVRAASYPPAGVRSQSSCRASLRGGSGYFENANAELMLIAMIEHIDAVKRCAEIASVPGVGACLVGPTDLNASLRSVGANTDPLAGAIEQAKSVLTRAGKPVGIAAGNTDAAKRHAGEGFGFIIHGTDRRLLNDSLTRTIAAWRGGAVRG